MRMKWKIIAPLICTLALILVLPIRAYAHGVNIEYTANVGIEIVAKYDAGEPMAGAQVAVYAPDDPSTPWLIGVCDDEGRFSFIPDISKPGMWDVQVRKAGHGDIIHILVGGDAAASASGGISGYTTLQIGLMAASVAWGSVGTALYFWRRRSA